MIPKMLDDVDDLVFFVCQQIIGYKVQEQNVSLETLYRPRLLVVCTYLLTVLFLFVSS